MAALICDICGGKLVMQSGAIAKCESCGMEYSRERVQEKVQEIKGTVKIDGAVEIIKGEAEKEHLIKSAEFLLTIDKVVEAREVYNKAIKEYPGDIEIWNSMASSMIKYGIILYGNTYNANLSLTAKGFLIDYMKCIDACPDNTQKTEAYNKYKELLDALKEKSIEDYMNIINDVSPNGKDHILGSLYDSFSDERNRIVKYKEIHKRINALEIVRRVRLFELMSNKHLDFNLGFRRNIPSCTYVYDKQVAWSIQNYDEHYGQITIINCAIEPLIDLAIRETENACRNCGSKMFTGAFKKNCAVCHKPKGITEKELL